MLIDIERQITLSTPQRRNVGLSGVVSYSFLMKYFLYMVMLEMSDCCECVSEIVTSGRAE